MNSPLFRFIGAAVLAVLAYSALSIDQTSRLVVGILVGLPSFLLMIISRRQLGGSFSVMPEAKVLVTKGLYSRIQHPMYVFLDLFLLGVTIAVGSPLLLILYGILVIGQTIQSRREEKLLANVFGADYLNYKKQTWF